MISKGFEDFKQNISDSACIAQGVVIVGNVTIEENSSIWYNSTIRGDVSPVIIGSNTNIQEGSIIHTNWNLETNIGNYVTVGHGAILHGCKIGSNTLIGMGAIIMDGAEIGENCVIGAGTLISQNKKIPSGSMVYGTPCEIKRQLTQEEIEGLRNQALEYVEFSKALIGKNK